MLHRSLESVYEHLREFNVAVDSRGRIVGCAAVDIVWADLAEIKSVAVDDRKRGKGVGGALIEASIKDARKVGVRKLFALTYEKEFFRRHGFKVTDRNRLPEKVWLECITCEKADACDEIAMMLRLD